MNDLPFFLWEFIGGKFGKFRCIKQNAEYKPMDEKNEESV